MEPMTDAPDREQRMELPLYSLAEAAKYLRVPKQTLGYWLFGRDDVPALLPAAGTRPRALSFMNMLEAHMLVAMRRVYDLKLPRIRNAMLHLRENYGHKHPFVEMPLLTDRKDILIQDLNQLVNVSRKGQVEIPELLSTFVERIELDRNGDYRFFPFVGQQTADAPRFISMSPAVRFGQPVLAGTGVSTAVISGRFGARESVDDLAAEYRVAPGAIEEAIQWESRAA